jgi:hypothetical protein
VYKILSYTARVVYNEITCSITTVTVLTSGSLTKYVDPVQSMLEGRKG